MIFIGGLIVGVLSLYAGVKAKKDNNKPQKNNTADLKDITVKDKPPLHTDMGKPSPLVEKDDATLTVQWANKNFNISSASLALVVAGNTLFMPLTFIGIAGLIYLVYPTWQKAYYDLTQKRRFTRMVLESIILPLTLLTGHIFSAALAYWFLYLALKIIAKAKHASIQNLAHVLINPVEQIVYVIRDDIEVELNLAEVQKNDVIVLNEGESIPISGLIVKGSATVEQHNSNNEIA
jgi:Cu2+-exporting ATPase